MNIWLQNLVLIQPRTSVGKFHESVTFRHQHLAFWGGGGGPARSSASQWRRTPPPPSASEFPHEKCASRAPAAERRAWSASSEFRPWAPGWCLTDRECAAGHPPPRPERYKSRRSTYEGRGGGQIWWYLPPFFCQNFRIFYKFPQNPKDFDKF